MPYSLWNMVAAMNAVAVCPDGKELWLPELGRCDLAVYLIPFTRVAMIATEKASAVIMRPHELRLFTPPIFSPSIRTAGAYCR